MGDSIVEKSSITVFRINENRVMDGGVNRYYDKVETKFATYTPDDFAKAGVAHHTMPMRVTGSYIAPGAILMPSYVNIGAYAQQRHMVDTWVTVGSCAQIRKIYICLAACSRWCVRTLASRPHHY